MSKKELNAWDRFWVWVKVNEKVIWVGLLVLLCPTFAFPVFSNVRWGSNPTRVTIFGKTVKALDYTRASQTLSWVGELRGTSFLIDDEGGSRTNVLDFLILREEANRLGIRVSDPELGAEIRQAYWRILAVEAAQGAVLKLGDLKTKSQSALQSAFVNTFQTTLNGLMVKNVFGDKEKRDWYERLQNGVPVLGRGHGRNQFVQVDRQAFEDALRDVLKTEKLEDYIRSTVQVTPLEELEEFKKSEQSRKFSFFELRADESRPEVEKTITDEELKARYERHSEELQEPLKLRVEYLSLPIAPFEKEVNVTEEDLQKEYERVKTQKYQTFVGGAVEDGFPLLTPEEKAERDLMAFRPFEEVQEEILADLQRVRAREAARTAAEQIRERLFPKPRGEIGEKKDEKAPPPAKFAEILKDYPTARTGTTPWVERKDAESTMGPEVYSTQISNWFARAEANLRGKGSKKLEVQQSYVPAPPSTEAQYFVFYQNPQVRHPGVPDLAEVKEKVREALVKEKLLERAREKARALADAVREGKKSFEVAAKEAGLTVVTTGFLGRSGTIKVPLSREEAKKAEGEKAREGTAGEDPQAREKEHPGSRAILEYGFMALHERGKVDGFAEDPVSSACYVVRWDDVIYPDPSRFEKERSSYHQKLLREKQNLYLADWRQELYQRAAPATPVRVDDDETRRRSSPPVDPYAE